MYNPTKAQWQVVIDNFNKVLPLAPTEDHLDMNEYQVHSSEHTCGTIHCVGGWYAVATCPLNKEYVGFIEGADQMAKHLGLPTANDLADWVCKNSQIWGNDLGGSMFFDHVAYDEARTLGDVIKFLERVRDRSPEISNT